MNNTRQWSGYNKNRSRNLVNHFHPNEDGSEAAPANLRSQKWLQNDAPQVEIIELDSDDSNANENDRNIRTMWDNLEKDRFISQSEYYQATRKARDIRMLNPSNYLQYSPETREYEISDIQNDDYSMFCDYTNDLLHKNKTRNQASCFTIVNKPIENSERSSDETEIIESPNTDDHLKNNDDGITFNDEVDITKRTICFYSIRNQRVLSDNNFELVKIPSHDSGSTSSSGSTNFIEETGKTKNICRVSSPMPDSYPKLNLLASNLPTVTEIKEPANTTPINENIMSLRKSVNYLNAEVTFPNKTDKSTNVLNWMCFSPHERLQRLKPKILSPTSYHPMLPVLLEKQTRSTELNYCSFIAAPGQYRTLDINTVEPKYNTAQTQTAESTGTWKIKDESELRNDSITVVDIEAIETNKEQVTEIIVPKSDRTNLKLQSNNWIKKDGKMGVSSKESGCESKMTESKNDMNHTYQVCAGEKLWVRNTSLMKPVQWSEFTPITESIPSLNLSVDSGKQTCLSRFIKCFQCFN